MSIPTSDKIIHAARIQGDNGKTEYLLLWKKEGKFLWFKLNSDFSTQFSAGIEVDTFKDAMIEARKKWKNNFFRTLNCGFYYTLPERDEHGMNALFSQMIAGYSSSNGVYFDEILGHNCFVNFASQEGLNLWHSLQHSGIL